MNSEHDYRGRRIPRLHKQSIVAGRMRKPRYDYEQSRKVFEAHLRSEGAREWSWLFLRFGLPVIAGILVAVVGYIFLSDPTDPLKSARLEAAAYFIGGALLAMLGVHSIYVTRCVCMLRRMDIDIPIDPVPSFWELWKERRELRQYGLENRKKWFFLRFVLPHLIFVALFFSVILLPGATFWMKPLGTQIVNTLVLWAVLAGYVTFVVEYAYLRRIWKRLQPESPCPPKPLMVSNAYLIPNDVEDTPDSS